MTIHDQRRTPDAQGGDPRAARDARLVERVCTLLAGQPPELALAAILDAVQAAGYDGPNGVLSAAAALTQGACAARVERLLAMASAIGLPLRVVFDPVRGPADAWLVGRAGDAGVEVRCDGAVWSWKVTAVRGRVEVRGSSRQELDGTGTREIAAGIRDALGAAAHVRERRDVAASGWLAQVMTVLGGQGLLSSMTGDGAVWSLLARCGDTGARVNVWFDGERMLWHWSSGPGPAKPGDFGLPRLCADPTEAARMVAAALAPPPGEHAPPQAAADAELPSTGDGL